MSTQSTVVFDLDGTLADCSARRHLVTGKNRDYDAFHARIAQDPINRWCKILINTFEVRGYDIAIVSARPKKYESQTRQWLAIHDVAYHWLHLLRENEDSTPDQEIKVAWLKKFGPENILFWVDDRLKVVKAIRECGVTVLHCAEGAY